MKRARTALTLLAMALGLITLSGCWSGDVTITQADAGTVQVARAGDRVTVRLAGNPSTGHTWTRTAPTDEEFAGLALQPIDEGTWEFPSDGRVPGSGGTCLFRYLAEEAGSVTLSFAYGRSWEPEPVQTFSVTVRVED